MRMSILQSAIEQATSSTEAFTPARKKALKAIKWRMATEDGRFAGLDPVTFACVLLPANSPHVQTFSAMDNEELKLRYWQSQLGTLTIVLL